mmetsp:Transcript_12117/g.18121  ORF Transcript_12117/g.18121 Transcript_12117/m.18121 type:complete len:84 (+) Transcript_12117:733-984(+)
MTICDFCCSESLSSFFMFSAKFLSAVTAVQPSVESALTHRKEWVPVPLSKNFPQGFVPWMLVTVLNRASSIENANTAAFSERT